MRILGVQIIALFFAFFMIYIAFLHWKRKDIKSKEVLTWMLLWAGFIVITLYPTILTGLTSELFFIRIMDFVMFIAFIIITFFVFNNYVNNRKLERKIESLVRQEALRSIKKKEKK